MSFRVNLHPLFMVPHTLLEVINTGGCHLCSPPRRPGFKSDPSYDVSTASQRFFRVNKAPQVGEEVSFGVKIKDFANSDHLLIYLSSSQGSYPSGVFLPDTSLQCRSGKNRGKG